MDIQINRPTITLTLDEILGGVGLAWDDRYNSIRISVINGVTTISNIPEDIADGVREFVEPYQARAAFKLSQLSGLTQEQLATYIDNNVTTLATAKEYIKKLSDVVLYLVKHTEMDR